MELIQQLVSNLGINEDQAKGGAGLIFKMAKEKLGAGEFGEVAQAVPGIDEMISAAPESGFLAKAVGSVTSMFGEKGGSLGGMAGVASGFSKLNLKSDMIGKFAPEILSFVQSKGGDTVKQILARVLK